MLAIAAIMKGLIDSSATVAGRTLTLRPPTIGGVPRPLDLLSIPPTLHQSPPYNQRKARRSRRARFAAGDRKAFRRP